MAAQKMIRTTGRRKCSIARVTLKAGGAPMLVNEREPKEYFKRETLIIAIEKPLRLTERFDAYGVTASLNGGGLTGQAQALRLGIARALIIAEPELRSVLKKAGLLTRDSRIVERKKYGQAGARRAFQFSKR
jgi:small subunit ribosomal protein S9